MQIDRWLNLTAPPAWLAVLGPADRVWWRALLVLVVGGAAALVLGLSVTAVFQIMTPIPLVEISTDYQACLDRRGADCAVEIPSLVKPTVRMEIQSSLRGGLVLAALAFGLLLVARPLLHRTIRSFNTTARRIRWGHLVFGLVSMGLVCGLLVLADRLLWPQDSDLSRSPLSWDAGAGLKLTYFAAAAFGILLAAWAEEVLFRGWVLQQTGAFTRNLPLILGLQAALFSLAHLSPDPGAFAIRVFVGLAYGWAALRLGGLEFAVGAHMANNLILAWFVGGLVGMKDVEFTLIAFGMELAQAAAVVILAEVLARRSSAAGAPAPSGQATPPANRP